MVGRSSCLVMFMICAVVVSDSQMMVGGNNKGYFAAALVTGRLDPTQEELKTNMGRIEHNLPAPPAPRGGGQGGGRAGGRGNNPSGPSRSVPIPPVTPPVTPPPPPVTPPPPLAEI